MSFTRVISLAVLTLFVKARDRHSPCGEPPICQWSPDSVFCLSFNITLYGSKHTPQGSNFYPFRSTMSRFRDTGPFTLDVRYHGNSHGNWDELTKTWYMVKNITQRAQIFIRLAIRWAVFRDTGPFTFDVRYHGNSHGNWDELTKTCYMVVNIPHRTQIFIRFALRWAVSEIQVRLL